MVNKKFIFLAGHHRSGTSLLHEILKEHKSISGFSHTGVPKDEGQHLQTVFKPASVFGGPGKYIYNSESYMNEHHPLATEKSALEIMREWEKYYDSEREYYIEKSPPNLIRTRFLQCLFPNSKFVIILRHPLSVSYATQKWSKTSIKALVEHTLRGYEVLAKDLPHLISAFIVRYEDFIQDPQNEIDKIYGFLGINSNPVQHEIKTNINDKYFSMWRKNRDNLFHRLIFPIKNELESRANKFGYSLEDCNNVLPCSLVGAHNRKN